MICWCVAPFLVDTAWWSTKAALIFAICGLFFPALSQPLSLKSVQVVGPNLSSAIGSCAPLFAAILATMFLGEVLGLQGVLGMTLLIAGLTLAALGPGKGIVRSWPLWALGLPIAASFFRGGAQALSKLGFEDLPSPFFATLVMMTVSSVILFLPFLRRQTRNRTHLTRRGAALFALNGIIAGGGILSLNAAISIGAVTIAAPLASTAPLWTLAYAAIFFRSERLTLRLLLIALIVVAGAILIVTRQT